MAASLGRTEDAPFVPWEISPEPAPDVDWEGAKSIKFVDLHKLPPGYIIRFHGRHPIAQYTCLPENIDGESRVRVWLDPQYGNIVGPVDNIVTDYWPGAKRRRGVMDTRGTYLMAYFVYSMGGQTEINYAGRRMEGYEGILIQKLPV